MTWCSCRWRSAGCSGGCRPTWRRPPRAAASGLGGGTCPGASACTGCRAFDSACAGRWSSSSVLSITCRPSTPPADDLDAAPAADWFGIGPMLRETEQQIDTEPVGERFVGDVVLAPDAVEPLLEWLLAQLADTQLIAGSSLHRDRVGEAIASALLGVRSRFGAAGCVPLSADAHLAGAVELVRGGVLRSLTPSLYGSRKTGLAHVPVAQGWAMAAGEGSMACLVAGVEHGAIVGRLSMGMPAANGDFAGVIKNSFAIVGGERGPALSETMISGNMAQMLRDIVGVSRERLDIGTVLLPWLRIAGLHFP